MMEKIVAIDASEIASTMKHFGLEGLPQSKPMGNRNYRDANSDHSSNPFSLSNTNLDQQVKLLERNPLWAKHMVMAAGRDPRFFGL